MGLLQKLKSALGLDGAESSGTTSAENVDVTVEREPATEAEDAVKGTDTTADGVEEEAATSADDTASSNEDAEWFQTEPDETDESGGEAVEGSEESVTEIKGIGPAYADRLAQVGIETVGELAAADAADIAADTDLGEGRVSDWIARANEY